MFARLLIAAASVALLTGVANAQADNAAPAPTTDSATSATPAPAPVDNSGYNARTPAPVDPNAQVVLPASSSALGDTTTLKAGDAGVVSNGPVLDTPENRAKYGKPDSFGGKKTAPAGN